MAANFAEGREASFARAGQLRARALELAEIELHAYEPVLDALRLPRDDPSRTERIETAKREASRSPLEVTQIAAEVAELAAELAHEGNEHLAGDAIVGTLLAEAAAEGAARLVAINLTDAPEVSEAAELAGRAQAARQQALT